MREVPTDLLRMLIEIVERAQARRAAAPSRRAPRSAKRLRVVKQMLHESAI